MSVSGRARLATVAVSLAAGWYFSPQSPTTFFSKMLHAVLYPTCKLLLQQHMACISHTRQSQTLSRSRQVLVWPKYSYRGLCWMCTVSLRRYWDRVSCQLCSTEHIALASQIMSQYESQSGTKLIFLLTQCFCCLGITEWAELDGRTMLLRLWRNWCYGHLLGWLFDFLDAKLWGYDFHLGWLLAFHKTNTLLQGL